MDYRSPRGVGALNSSLYCVSDHYGVYALLFCAGRVSSDLLVFECSMLVMKDCVEGAFEGGRQSKWRLVRCLDDGNGTGDRDDYKTLIGYC